MTIGNQNAANTVARLSPEQRAELESAIAEINALRGKKDCHAWRQAWTTAHSAAATALGTSLGTSIDRGNRDNSWNELIDLLDAYRPDWRGYVVHYLGDIALLYARHTGPYPVEALTVVACRCHIEIGGPRWEKMATRKLRQAIAAMNQGVGA